MDRLLVELQKGGWVLIPIFIVAQIGWFYVLERFLFFRKCTMNQSAFWSKMPSKSDEIIQYVINFPRLRGYFGTLARSIASENTTYQRVETARELLGGQGFSLQRHLSTISAAASAAPLLGLLGTVAGMVTTFQVITQYGVGNPVLLARGISEALLTTQAGLVAAFPLLLLHNYLVNRADRLETECIHGATRLLNAVERGGAANG